MEQSYHVTLGLDDCRDLIYDAVTDSVTGALIGSHTVEGRRAGAARWMSMRSTTTGRGTG